MPSEIAARASAPATRNVAPGVAGFLPLLAGALVLAACGRSQEPRGNAHPLPEAPAAAEPAPAPAPAAGTARGVVIGTDSAPDVRALLDTVTARLLRGDTVGLVRLLVDDSAWRRGVWPASPGHDPRSEEAFRFVLAMHKANAAKGLRRALAEARGPDGAPAAFLRGLDSASAEGGVLYTVRAGAGVRPFGSALCAPGACRVVSYAPSAAGPRNDRASRSPGSARGAGPVARP